MNSYATVAELKAAQQARRDSEDAEFRFLGEGVSRAIDRYCKRPFYVQQNAESVYSVNVERQRLLFLREDWLEIDSLELDLDQDGTFETEFAAADWVGEPLNRAYVRRLVLREGNSTVDTWPPGPRMVRVTGTKGYSNELEDLGITVQGGGISSSATALTVSDGESVSPGMTLVIGSEQLYVTAVAANVATVKRGGNGSTAAAHSAGASVSRQVYPADLVLACRMQVSRFQKEQRTGGANAIGGAEFGGYQFNSLYPAIRDILTAFRAPYGG